MAQRPYFSLDGDVRFTAPFGTASLLIRAMHVQKAPAESDPCILMPTGLSVMRPFNSSCPIVFVKLDSGPSQVLAGSDPYNQNQRNQKTVDSAECRSRKTDPFKSINMPGPTASFPFPRVSPHFTFHTTWGRSRGQKGLLLLMSGQQQTKRKGPLKIRDSVFLKTRRHYSPQD